MLYTHIFLTCLLFVAAIAASILLAAFAVGTVSEPSKERFFAIMVVSVILFFLSSWPLARLIAACLPSRCPNCKDWTAHIIASFPISYLCTACHHYSATNFPIPKTWSKSCPNCGRYSTLEHTGSAVGDAMTKAYGKKCRNCGHLLYEVPDKPDSPD